AARALGQAPGREAARAGAWLTERAALLDRPVWAALSGPQAGLSEGGALARRYRPDVNRFASARADDDPEALEALAALVAPGETVYVLQVPEIRIPPGLEGQDRRGGVRAGGAGAREEATGERLAAR